MNVTVAKLSAVLHCLNFKVFFPYHKQRSEECLTQYNLQIKNFFISGIISIKDSSKPATGNGCVKDMYHSN